MVSTYRVWPRHELFQQKLTKQGFRASELNLFEFNKNTLWGSEPAGNFSSPLCADLNDSSRFCELQGIAVAAM